MTTTSEAGASYVRPALAVAAAPSTTRKLLFLAAHVPLGYAMKESESVATAHALLTVLAAVFVALTAREAERLAPVAGYICGSEVLWRMAEANIFHESGKYTTIAMLLIAGLRFGSLASFALPGLYVLMLVPAVLMVGQATSYGDFHVALSVNLTGPAALAICYWFFAGKPMTPATLQRLLSSLIAPALAIVTIAFVTTSTSQVEFTLQSNRLAAGGFGPNQVSASLGLGATAAVLHLSLPGTTKTLKAILALTILALLAQALLTFSRGGMYTAVGALMIAATVSAPKGGVRLGFAAAAAVVIGIMWLVVLPRLDAFTGGALAERFSDTSSSGRAELLETELELWLQSPIFGQGPNITDIRGAVSHTEYTRLLAEHGLFGLVALVLMLYMAARSLLGRQGRDSLIAATFAAWALLYMCHAAMRNVAPALLIGLAAMRMQSTPNRETEPV